MREDVRIDGTEPLALHHLYRAMDVLEAHQEDIEHALYFRLADLLNLDVELIFYDTTSLHFAIDEIDQGQVTMISSKAAWRRLAPQGAAQTGSVQTWSLRCPAIAIGLAVTRDGLPVRHWVFPGNTVDVSTVAQVQDDLRGWKLRRCVFVGDAGMVSQDNLDRLRERREVHLVYADAPW